MDPTKNFDHLDPKLKETYARVMGTVPGGTTDTTQGTVTQPAPADPTGLSATPVATPPQDITSLPKDQFNAAPLDQQPLSPSPVQDYNMNMGPNPGTGPTINSIPTDTTTMVPPPVQSTLVEPQSDMTAVAPTTSTFFSNPSPATADPAQNPVQPSADSNLSTPFTPIAEPDPTPVTPYSPEGTATAAPTMGGIVEPITQPLPSPSSVAQSTSKQSSPLLKVLYIIAAVIFFAIYTVFWIKVFGLPIPFLNF